MSDNIIRPSQWLENGQHSLETAALMEHDAKPVAGGGGGPHDPGMEARVAALESDLREAKATLGRLEVAASRIQATLDSLATRSDVTTAIERIASLDGRTGRLEAAVADTVRSAVGKAIGPWQLPAVVGACGGIVVLIVGALGWLAHQPWFNR